jgi:MFS family permease
LAHERRVPAPLLDLGLYARRSFAAGVAGGLLSYLVLFGVLFATPFFLESALRLRPGRAGLVLTVLPVAVALVAPAAGRLADRVGARPPTVGGMLVCAAALAALAAAHGGGLAVAAGLAGAGAGLGAFTPANNAAIMASAPPTQSGMAGGVLNMTRGIGTALGVAVAGLVLGTAGAPAAGFRAAVATLAAVAAAAAVAARLPGGRRPTGQPSKR